KMTENKTIVEKVTALLAKFTKDNSEDSEQKFEDVKTNDGVVLRISELAEGGTVAVISEDGEVAGSGDYTLEDNTVISVSEEGVITSVTPAEESEDVEEEEMSDEAKAAAEKTDAPAEDEDEDKKPSKFETETLETLGAIALALEGFTEKFTAIDGEIKKINEAPAEEEFATGKKGETPTKENALEALSKFRKQNVTNK
ncbi:MAG: hypothetical protein KUG64_10700, partial [Cycloclasticus sp.]|nr:hypothetical protein [Cycloclasticus sp.]